MAELFGTDGIRGRAGEVVTPEISRRLGSALVEILKPEVVFLVRDTRESGPQYLSSAWEGIAAEGVEAHNAGIAPTPAVAYFAMDRGAAGLAVTASHNLYYDNGLKVFKSGGVKPDEAETEAMDRLITSPSPQREKGDIGATLPDVREDLARSYEGYLCSTVQPQLFHGQRVVIDAANGAASLIGVNVFEQLGATVQAVASHYNGKNINDGCGTTCPERIKNAVQQSNADFGVTLDGDADRVMLASANGQIIDGDCILLILALWAKQRGDLPGNTIVCTSMSNMGLEVALRKEGIGVVRTDVGDKNVLSEMSERNLLYGGEQSGHIIMKHLANGDRSELAHTGDGLLTALQVMQIVADSGHDLDSWAALMDYYPRQLVRITVPDLYKRVVAEDPEVLAAVKAVSNELGEAGMVNVRPSGTEPVVRVMVQATDKETVEILTGHLQKIIGEASERIVGR
jgi:phosphoglucosamine mutase